MNCDKIIKYCDSYIKKYEQLIIIITGLSGTNKIHLGQYLSEKLNIDYINHIPFIDKKENINSDKYIKWDKFNKKINKLKSHGLIITSPVFPTDLINFKVDVHINLYISKTQLKENVKSDLKPELEKDNLKYINQLYSYYIDTSKRSKFDIVYDIKDNIDLESELLNYICKCLYNNYDEQEKHIDSSDKSEEIEDDKYENVTHIFNDDTLIVLKY